MPERFFPGCNINGRICQKWTTIVVRISGVIMFARWLRSLRHLLGHTAKESHKKNAGHTMSTAWLARRKKRLVRPYQPIFDCLEGRVTPSTLTVGAARDNSIFSESPNNSDGASYDLFTGRTNQSGGAYRRSLIYFDLSALPSGAVIDSVSLTMVMSGGAPSGLGAGGDHPQGYTGPLDISLDRMLANWGAGSSGAGMGNGGSVAPGTGGPPGGSGGASHGFAATPGDATWIYNSFNTSSWTTPGGDYVTTPSATQGVSINPQYVTWSSSSLVSDVQGWVNNSATNFGWMIVGDESTNGTSRLFVSSESPNTAYRPALTIVYDVPTIGTQPTGATIDNGQSDTLSVTAADGTPGYTYQWYTGTSGTTTSPISGATGSSYVAAPTSTTNYWVRVTDSAGASIDSSTATVTVNPALSLSPALPAGAVGVGYNQTIAAFGGTGSVTLAVTNIQNPIPGLTIPTSGTGSINVTGTPTASGVVTFTVTATDAAGATATANYSFAVHTGTTLVSQTGSLIATPGNQLFSVAVGDLNGDGKQDLVFGNGVTPGSLIIETGNGNGTFQNVGSISIGSSIGFIRDVKMVNLDGGQFPDLVATAFSGNDVVILKNTTTQVGATPTFTVAATIPVGVQPFWITTGDFSGDGNRDIVTANFAGNSITVIPNTSSGPGNFSFGTPTTISIPGGGPRAVEAIPINGKLGLVVADMSNATLSIFQNTSTGPGNVSFTLASTITMPSGSAPNALAIGDFNNDGQPDIAAGSFTSGNVYVLLNQGNGTFSSPTTIPNPGVSNTVDLIAGDFNGDGNADLAIVGSTTNNASVLYGNGAGAFPTVETYAMGVMPWKVASGDFNGDGAPDLVVTNLSDDTAIVLLNQAAASALRVTPSTTTPTVGANFTVTVNAQANGTTYQNYSGTVTLTDSNGLILGTHTFTPSDHGSYAFSVSLPTAGADTITASDGTLVGTTQVNVVALGTTVIPLPADTVNVAYNQTITAGGGTGPYTLTVGDIQNAIPGLIVPGSGTDSLTINGTPTTTGTEVFTVTTTDSLNNTTVATYSITVNPGITLSPPTLSVTDVNLTYNSVISASGGTGPVTLTVSNVVNAIPGLNVPTSGSVLDITGIPTAAGTETFTVTATDALGATATTSYSITVNPAVSLSPTAGALPADTLGVSYNQTITASGGTGTKLVVGTISNAPGLNVVVNGLTISITGTPTASGTVAIPVYAYDSLDSKTNPNFSYTITVNAAPTLSALPTAAVTTNLAYSQTITASGGTGTRTLTVSNITNAIPGLVIPNSGTTSLAITGTPTAAGTMTFTVTATDAVGATVSANYSITVRNPVPTLSNVSINSQVAQGSPATLTGTINGPAGQTFTLVVNWGDGSSPQTFNLPAGTTTFSETHTYLTPATNTVNVTVGDNDYSNNLLYGSTGSTATGQLFVFDLATGSATLVGNLPGANVTEIVANPATGQAWLQFGNNVFKGQQFNVSTGAAIGGTITDSPGENFNGLVFIGNTLYATGTTTTGGTAPSDLRILDPNTGISTLIGATGISGPVSGLAYNPATGILYGIKGGSVTTNNLVTLNLTTGAATTLFSTNFAGGSLAFGPDGQLYAGSSTGQLFRIDLGSQTVTPVSATGLTSALSGLTTGNDTASVQTSVYAVPTLSISGASTVNEGTTYTLNLFGTDPSPNVINNWTITWGDGSAPQTVMGNPSLVTHVYAAGPNNYTISATATDEYGTYSASNTVSVGVLHIPPIISVSGLNLVNKGAIYTLNLSGSDTAPHAINSWSITWGDGSPAQTVAGSATTVTHVFTSGPVNVTISATATDDVATYSAGNTVGVSVTNVSRPVLAISGAGAVNEGATYTLWLSGTQATGHPIMQWTINWGDGSVLQVVPGNPMSVTHVFASGPHSYTISGTATDNVGTYNATNTPSVSVLHVSPKLTLSGAGTVSEAAAYTLNLSAATNGGHAINAWHINWGDGSGVQTVSGNPLSTTHVYASGPHNYTISATATDDVGTYNASNTVAVSVKHVAPILAISGASAVNEGSTYSLNLSAGITAGHAITKWVITWGDGSAAQTVIGNPSTVTHVYRDGPNSFTIRATATDDVGTYNAGNTLPVTVNNVPPTLVISGPATVNEKANYVLSLSHTDPGADTISKWTIVWDDGSAPQTVIGNPASVTHVFAVGPNHYTILATATDEDGTYSVPNTVDVTVNHVPPTLTLSGAASVNETGVYTLRLSGTDTHPISQWTINWGDGSAPQTLSGNPTSVTHVFAYGPQTNTITATATDALGTYSAGNSLAVAVQHLPPKVTFGGATTVNEGAPYVLTLSGIVIGNHAISQWTINWGDGTAHDTVTGNPTTATHVYAVGPHNYIISATATDDVGTYSAGTTLTVAVKHVAPVLTISGAAEVNEGSTYTLNLAGSDGAGHTISRWAITWGDGSAVQTVTGNPSSVMHVYRDGPNHFTIKATATDDVATFNAGNTIAITVDNVAPTLTISGAPTVDEGTAYTLQLSHSDPGADTIIRWMIITWGDGTSSQSVPGSASSVTHVYAKGPGTYTILASATDEDGTYNAGNTVTVAVNHVPPTLSISGKPLVISGSTYTLNLSGVDRHAIANWSINWGDGSPTQTVSGNPSSVTHVFPAGAGNYSISATATDDVATYSAANTVNVNVYQPPILSISGVSLVNEGSLYTLNLTGIAGSSNAPAITRWTITWGDGSAAQTVIGNPPTVTHVYKDGPNTFTIRATASDGIGTFTAGNTVGVMVMNVAPDVDDQRFAVGNPQHALFPPPVAYRPGQRHHSHLDDQLGRRKPTAGCERQSLSGDSSIYQGGEIHNRRHRDR